jgi:hypothetical protein
MKVVYILTLNPVYKKNCPSVRFNTIISYLAAGFISIICRLAEHNEKKLDEISDHISSDALP